MLAKIKALAKKLIPERYRLSRYELWEKLRYYPELFFSLGTKLECPFCDWRFRRFRPAGFDYPVLREKKVVGASYHLDDVCPRCMSNARERLVYLYLQSKTSILREPMKVLHIAPEPNLSRVLRGRSNLRYFTGDLFGPGVMTRLDIVSLPFADSTFDIVICNHVLEHVSDDRFAMAELHRVLKPQGWALLQVPIALALAQTFEDPSAKSDADRIRLFGQKDHVRLYAEFDYLQRLGKTGFDVKIGKATDFGQETLTKYALIREEQIFVGTKYEGVQNQAS